MVEEIKRLFFGIEVHAPWPSLFPKGRILKEAHRHLTLAFLGNIPHFPLLQLLDCFPIPFPQIGTTGFFDSCLILPPHHPHVVAWQAQGWEDKSQLQKFHFLLSQWLVLHHYSIDSRSWKPHVTLCRQPFDSKEWIKAFKPLPFYTSNIHLYESKGNLNYIPIWSVAIQAPFEEIEHTADMAFMIYGETLKHLYHNAFASLAFKAPELLGYFIANESIESLTDVIILLNAIICRVDAAVGCSLKAVSFHGEIIVQPDSLLQWEMIVDV